MSNSSDVYGINLIYTLYKSQGITINHIINMLKVSNYDYDDWETKFPKNKVAYTELIKGIHSSWKPLFYSQVKQLKRVEDMLTYMLQHYTSDIYPHPDLVFNVFKKVPLNKIKVVILGQDPYHNYELFEADAIPEACGLSFSVLDEFTVPSSLQNIYKNLLKYKHLHKLPKNGDLSFWAYQGCFLLNTSLSVIQNKAGCHTKYWKKFTDNVIKYISSECEDVIFVLWGRHAYGKENLIDKTKHKIIVSSHPSGLSCYKPMGEFKAFDKQDHFGQINKFLKKKGKTQIVWGF